MYRFQTTLGRRGYFVTGAAVVPETFIQHWLQIDLEIIPLELSFNSPVIYFVHW